jgi:Alternative complex III, ActD subunit
MADRDIAAFGLFPDRDSLEHAVNDLRAAGFRNSDVSVLMQETPGTKDLAHEAHSKAPEGAAAGASAGAVVGGVLGWLIGIGAIAIPGIGPFIAGGPIVAALAGLGAAGTAGGLIGALVGVGIPEYEAKLYEGRLRKGHLLLSVHCDDSKWSKRAAEILKKAGGRDIATTTEAHADYHP